MMLTKFIFQPKDVTFKFPDLFDNKKNEDEENMKSLDEAKKTFSEYLDKNKDRKDVPSWFSI